MNNKELGNNFEQTMCSILANNGYWAHFITPDARGAQPFDIIAAKDNIAYAIECKTLTFSRRYFTIDRLEDNQILAFARWRKCGNKEPIIAVEQNNHIASFNFRELEKGKIDIHAMCDTESVLVSGDGYAYYVHGVLRSMLNGL